MTLSVDPVFALSGLFVGAVVGMTGVGGGSLMTPILVLVLGVHPASAVGTDLLYAGLTKAVGVGVHQRRHAVDWRIVGLLCAGSIPGAALTLYWLHVTGPGSPRVQAVISIALGIALLATAGSLLARNRILALAARRSTPDERARAFLTIATGLAIGVLVSISSVGAGAIGVTALYFLYPQLPARRIVGSDIAHAVPLTLVAGAGHWALGLVDFGMLGSLLVGSIPGIVIGSLGATRVPDVALRYALAFILAVVGARLALS